ncbi:MAG: alkaline phosphatase family protein, partial [Planctomycetota bacterium]
MRKAFYLILVSCGLCPAVLADEASTPESPRNIILFGWDGAQREHVKEALERGELPILKKLADEGAMVDIDIYGVTDTKAGWSEIITGYGPKKTGVYSNRKYQPIPEGYSVFERLEKHFGDDAFVTVAIIGKSRHCGERNPPKKIKLKEAKEKPAAATQPAEPKAQKKKRRRPLGKIVVEEGVRYRLVPGSPYYHTAENTDVWIYGLRLDEKVGTKAL